MIDLILINRKWRTSVQQCRTYQGVDIESDHSLVISNVKLKLNMREKQPLKKQRHVVKLKKNDAMVKCDRAKEMPTRCVSKQHR